MTSDTLGKVIILTALPVEEAAVLHHLKDIRNERHPAGTQYQVGRLGSLTVSVAQIGAGNSNAALETERMISHFSSDLAFFIGIAGGVKDVDLGDVVAATKVYGYESGSDKGVFEPRPEVGLASYPLVQQARAVIREGRWLDRIQHRQPRVPRGYLGAIAAGAKVIKSSAGTVADLLRKNYSDTLAVEMEGEGFMRAAYSNRVEAIVVRGISDLLDGKAVADRSGSQEAASDHAAAFGIELLARLAERSVLDVVGEAGPGGTQRERVPDQSEFWIRLREVTPRLYPRGPDEQSVWEEAGGDLSYLNLSENGRTQWSRAIRLLERGGGGITATSLIERMIQDYSKNYELQYLRTQLPL